MVSSNNWPKLFNKPKVEVKKEGIFKTMLSYGFKTNLQDTNCLDMIGDLALIGMPLKGSNNGS